MVAGRDGHVRSLPSIDVATQKARADQKVVYNPDDPDAMRVWLVHVQGLLDDKDLLHVTKHGALSFEDWSTSHDHNLDIADDSQSKVLIRMYHTYLVHFSQQSRQVYNLLTRLPGGSYDYAPRSCFN